MQKDEPVILTSALDESEILDWMQQKISLASQLKAARQHREVLLRELDIFDVKISELTEKAGLKILPKGQGPIPAQEHQEI